VSHGHDSYPKSRAAIADAPHILALQLSQEKTRIRRSAFISVGLRCIQTYPCELGSSRIRLDFRQQAGRPTMESYSDIVACTLQTRLRTRLVAQHTLSTPLATWVSWKRHVDLSYHISSTPFTLTEQVNEVGRDDKFLFDPTIRKGLTRVFWRVAFVHRCNVQGSNLL